MSIKYSFQNYDEQTMVCAIAKNLSISTKQAVEISSFLKGKTDVQAERILSEAADLKKAIPFTRFTEGAGHKPGIASGKYPVKAASAILDLLNSAKTNAENKGLGSPLKIVHLVANAGGNSPRYGRQRGRSAKKTHVELILAETADSKKELKSKKKKVKTPVKETEVVKETKEPKEVKKPKVKIQTEPKETKIDAKAEQSKAEQPVNVEKKEAEKTVKAEDKKE